MIKNKKQMFSLIISFILVILLGTVTYAFFNYTRTGAVNNLGTGRIYFNSSQSNTLNITNLFPMTSTEAGNANLDSVTISITGDTTYTDGEEFEISIVDVNNIVNGKEVAINYIANYTAATGGTIGTSSNNYWNARNSKDASIYTLNATGLAREGKQVLVGYIDNGATGINGNLTISAYIDSDRIAITDTYPSKGEGYNVNPAGASACVSYFTSLGLDESLQEGETLNAFCSGTGTINGLTFQEMLDELIDDPETIEYMIEHNIITERNYSNETTFEWVRGREVFTTSEWNSLVNTPISFKIRAESNEGIWVEKKETIDSCPGCKFLFSTDAMYMVSNDYFENPTVLTSNDYKDNYSDVIAESGQDYFLGVKLNSSNQITNAYACGVKNGVPFCIEGNNNHNVYDKNVFLLNSSSLWNNTCILNDTVTSTAVPVNNNNVNSNLSELFLNNSSSWYEKPSMNKIAVMTTTPNITCGPWNNSGNVSVYNRDTDQGNIGYASVGMYRDNDDYYYACFVINDGKLDCSAENPSA